jgi:hypothetical protein
VDGDRFALIALLGSATSCVIFCVILWGGWRRYLAVGLVGIAAGFLIAGVPKAHKHFGILMSDGLGVTLPAPVVTPFLALALAGFITLLLRTGPLHRLGKQVRINLTPTLWFSPEEIAHRARMSRRIVEALSAGIKAPMAEALHIMARLKVAVTALSGSCIALFFALPAFQKDIVENITWGKIAINLVATVFMTFFLGPLHEKVVEMGHGRPASHAPQARSGDSARTWPRLLKLVLIFLALFILQVLHSATHHTLAYITAFQIIVLLEFCVLPVVVTSYYLVAAVHRHDLGGRQWDRALGACIWAGTIVLIPFAFVAVTTIEPPFALFKQVLAKPSLGGAAMLTGTALILSALGVALSVIVAGATYGLFSLALAFAMADATRANARDRAALAIIAAGIAVQIVVAVLAVLKLIPTFEGIERSIYYYAPFALSLGWAAGIYVSRFEERLPVPVETSKVPA